VQIHFQSFEKVKDSSLCGICEIIIKLMRDWVRKGETNLARSCTVTKKSHEETKVTMPFWWDCPLRNGMSAMSKIVGGDFLGGWNIFSF
jgi:hypothetical protein